MNPRLKDKSAATEIRLLGLRLLSVALEAGKRENPVFLRRAGTLVFIRADAEGSHVTIGVLCTAPFARLFRCSTAGCIDC